MIIIYMAVLGRPNSAVNECNKSVVSGEKSIRLASAARPPIRVKHSGVASDRAFGYTFSAIVASVTIFGIRSF